MSSAATTRLAHQPSRGGPHETAGEPAERVGASLTEVTRGAVTHDERRANAARDYGLVSECAS